jgi:hypothetical protein
MRRMNGMLSITASAFKDPAENNWPVGKCPVSRAVRTIIWWHE